MSKKLMRVPLDFDYPINKIWEGYLNPHYKKCPHCDGGSTPARERLSDLVNLIMISGSDSIRGENHPYFTHIGRFVTGFNSAPSKDMVELTSGLADRSPSPFGHDAIDRWTAVDKIIKAAGLDPDKWGICEHCKGNNIDPEVREQYDTWKEYDPPSGEGYQLWETTTEGSPQSPVFKTLESLCEWCEKNAHTFGSETASKEKWFKMLSENNVHHHDGNMLFI